MVVGSEIGDKGGSVAGGGDGGGFGGCGGAGSKIAGASGGDGVIAKAAADSASARRAAATARLVRMILGLQHEISRFLDAFINHASAFTARLQQRA